MAQLSDDCFAFGGPLMSVDEAVDTIAARVRAVTETEWVDLVYADGRVLASDITAPLALPSFTNSAVDGYAVRSVDLPRDDERAFEISARVQAGSSSLGAVAAGEAVRIFTGAPFAYKTTNIFVRVLFAGNDRLPNVFIADNSDGLVVDLYGIDD